MHLNSSGHLNGPGNTGIMTYMISHHGKTYERDLGAETSKVA